MKQNEQPVTFTADELARVREELEHYGLEIEAKRVRDHYTPRKMGGDTCIAYQGETPTMFLLELLAALAVRSLGDLYPDDIPGDHIGTFLDHLDILREAAQMIGTLDRDQLLDDQIWYLPDLTCESEASRKEMMQDVRAQVEAEVARRSEELIRQGFEAGYHAAHTGTLPDPQRHSPTGFSA